MTHVIPWPDDADHAGCQVIELPVHLVLICSNKDVNDLDRFVHVARRKHSGREGRLDHLELWTAQVRFVEKDLPVDPAHVDLIQYACGCVCVPMTGMRCGRGRCLADRDYKRDRERKTS